jgi:diaphanous 1
LHQPGFTKVLSSPTTITHIAYSLHASSLKLRTLSSEVLAAICVLSLDGGHKAVLAAMSDYRIAYEESFRFETLIGCLRPVDFGSDTEDVNVVGFGNEEEGVWEARTASMALINALTNCPELLEDRVLLREEFGRRGLNEVIVVRGSINLHSLQTLIALTIGFEVYKTPRRPVDSTRRLYGGEVRR